VADAWVHVRVQAISLVVLPAVGYGIAVGLRAGGFNRYLADGFIVMAAMPTTVSTNVVFTQRAGGNEPAALVNAVIGGRQRLVGRTAREIGCAARHGVGGGRVRGRTRGPASRGTCAECAASVA
jgi:hypothetical protein